jgi:hypothetical protein
VVSNLPSPKKQRISQTNLLILSYFSNPPRPLIPSNLICPPLGQCLGQGAKKEQEDYEERGQFWEGRPAHQNVDGTIFDINFPLARFVDINKIGRKTLLRDWVQLP